MIQTWNGTEWVNGELRYWDGVQWRADAPVRRWTGLGWEVAVVPGVTPEPGGDQPYVIRLGTAFANYPGIEFAQDGMTVYGTGRYLSPLPDTEGDTPTRNPHLNLDYRVDVAGAFQFNATIRLNEGHDSYISLYGTPPIIQDEWRMEVNSLRLEFVGSTLWWSFYDQDGNYTGTFVDMDFGEETDIQVNSEGTRLALYVNSQEIFNRSFSTNPFSSGKMYFSLDDDSGSGSYVLQNVQISPARNVTIAPMTLNQIAQSPDSLRVNMANYYPRIRIGTAVAPIPLITDAKYQEVLGREFSQITPENAMKMQFLQPSQGEFVFHEADKIVDFAELNGIDIHGHTLAWEEAVPMWVHEGGFTASQLRTILEDHIATVVGRYKGRIKSWDVINEPFYAFTDQLRTSVWYDAMGRDYIRIALEAAHAADPSAKLYINEWGCEEAPSPGGNQKQDYLYNLCVELLDAGVPLHGVGFQMHEDMNAEYQDYINRGSVTGPMLLQAIQRFKSLGLEVRISEFDVNMHQIYDDTEQAQAEYFREIFGAALDGRVSDFCMWGFTDKYSSLQAWYDWNGLGNGLIYDANIEPKAPYYALRARIKHEAYQPPSETVKRPNLLVYPYISESATWLDVSDSVDVEKALPDEKGYSRAAKITFTGPDNHQQWKDLADKLIPGHRHVATTWVNKNTAEGFSGQFQHAYYDVSTNLIGTNHTLSGDDWEAVTYEFVAPDAPSDDPSWRILGWGEGQAGESILIGYNELVDLDMEYTSDAQPEGEVVPAGSEVSHPLPHPKPFYMPAPDLQGEHLFWAPVPQSDDIQQVLADDFGCDPNGDGNWDWYATEVRPASEAPFNERFLRTHIDAGMYVGSDTAGGTKRRGTGWENVIMSAEQACLTYQLRFSPGFDFGRGGKIPGLYSGNSPSGGSPATDGNSSRFMFRRDGAGELYQYAMNTEDTPLKSIGRGTWYFVPGKWHTVKQQIILNTPGRDNGIARIWVDGKPMFEQHGLVFRDRDAIKLNGVMATIFLGGGTQDWAVDQDQYIDHGNYRIYAAEANLPTNLLGSNNYMTLDSDWESAIEATREEGYPDQNGDPKAVKISFVEATGHHQTLFLTEPLPTGTYELAVWVNPDTTEGYAGTFELGYFEGSSSIEKATPDLNLGGGWQQVTHSFTVSSTAVADPRIRIIGYRDGNDGDAIGVGEVTLYEL